MENAKCKSNSDTPLISAPTKRAKRQAIRAALATLGYRVGQGQVNGYSFRLVIQAGGAKC